MSTISDVARQAGVGLATVSRVLNGSDAVRPETRARVLAAMDELSYLPSAAARALSRRRTDAIGVVMPLADHPASAERLRGAVRHLASTAYDLVLFNTTAVGRADGAIPGMFARQRTDGLLWWTTNSMSVTGAACSGPTCRRCSSAWPRPTIPASSPTTSPVGRLATKHLLAAGTGASASWGTSPARRAARKSCRWWGSATSRWRPTPGLTTVAVALERSGQLAAERLLRQLGGTAGPPDRLELAPELVARATTGPPPA